VFAVIQLQPLRRLLPGEMLASDSQALYVLTAEYLQKWALKQDSDRVCLHNLNLLISSNIAQCFNCRLK